MRRVSRGTHDYFGSSFFLTLRLLWPTVASSMMITDKPRARRRATTPAEPNVPDAAVGKAKWSASEIAPNLAKVLNLYEHGVPAQSSVSDKQHPAEELDLHFAPLVESRRSCRELFATVRTWSRSGCQHGKKNATTARLLEVAARGATIFRSFFTICQATSMHSHQLHAPAGKAAEILLVLSSPLLSSEPFSSARCLSQSPACVAF